MNRPILISLVLHFALIAGVVWATEREGRMPGPPRRAYMMVDIVGPQGPKGWLGSTGQKGRKTEVLPSRMDPIRERTRSGLKVEKAPSTDPFSPKGTKKPSRASKQKPGEDSLSQRKGGKGAPGGGGGGLRLEGNHPFPFPEYLEAVRDRVEDHWEAPLVVGGQAPIKATVFFKILKDGTIVDCAVVSQSGLLPFDRATLNAVLSASPMPPLPEKFPGDSLGVYFDFEY